MGVSREFIDRETSSLSRKRAIGAQVDMQEGQGNMAILSLNPVFGLRDLLLCEHDSLSKSVSARIAGIQLVLHSERSDSERKILKVLSERLPSKIATSSWLSLPCSPAA